MKCSGVQITNQTTEKVVVITCGILMTCYQTFPFLQLEIYFVELYYISINDKMCHLKRYRQVLLRVTMI